jgi:two-component system sensor histidine kinase UhpB
LITAIRLEADFLKQECENQSEDIVSSISEITNISSDVLKSIRNVTNRLRPSSMTHNSIVDTLKELHYNWKKHNRDIVSSFQSVDEVIELPDSISIVLYRVLQECLTNIARHAKNPKQVRINLFSGSLGELPENIINDTQFKMTSSPMITLTVEDDGNGFDVNTSHHGNGLAGMRERLQSIDGQFHISSQPGIGTKIVASLPLSFNEISKNSLLRNKK